MKAPQLHGWSIGLVMCFAATVAHAQSTGTLRLLIDPGASFRFVLDHKYDMQQREVELGTGPHHFTFWAPERSMLDTTLTVSPGRVQDIVLHLPYSAEYKAYASEYRTYRNRTQLYKAVPAVITLGCAVWALASYSGYTKAADRLDEDEAHYQALVVPGDITELKNVTVPQHNKEFRDARSRFTISAVATGVALLGTAWLWHRAKKRPAPVFEDKEKVRFEGLAWMPGQRNGEWMIGMNLALR